MDEVKKDVNIIDIGNVTVEDLSTDGQSKVTNPNDVYFRVKYPKDWQGEKAMPEDVVIISKESAEHFTSIGIGKIIK